MPPLPSGPLALGAPRPSCTPTVRVVLVLGNSGTVSTEYSGTLVGHAQEHTSMQPCGPTQETMPYLTSSRYRGIQD